MFEFFQCWFLERHPWNRNSTLKIVSACTYMTAVHMWFQARFRHVRRAFVGCSKKRKTLQIAECKKQLYGSLLWKSENICHNCGTKQGHPLHRSVHALKQRQYGLLQAIPGCIIPDVVNRTFGNRTQSHDWVRFSSVIELYRTHKNVPVRLCSIAEPIERLGSIGFWFGSRIDYAGIM